MPICIRMTHDNGAPFQFTCCGVAMCWHFIGYMRIGWGKVEKSNMLNWENTMKSRKILGFHIQCNDINYGGVSFDVLLTYTRYDIYEIYSIPFRKFYIRKHFMTLSGVIYSMVWCSIWIQVMPGLCRMVRTVWSIVTVFAPDKVGYVTMSCEYVLREPTNN